MNNTNLNFLPNLSITKEMFAFIEAGWKWNVEELKTRMESGFSPFIVIPPPHPDEPNPG